MARRSLRPQLNQIRAWARQGRTDAWIAHQLDVSVTQVEEFRRENELGDEIAESAGGADFGDEIDLRAEDDALIAAELEAAAAEAALRAQEDAERAAAAGDSEDENDGDDEDDGEDGDTGTDGEAAPKSRRRGRRGGRGRRRPTGPLEGTFDHGEDGYGLWLDPAVQDNPVYAEHWAGHRQVEVTIEEEQIVIRRVGGED